MRFVSPETVRIKLKDNHWIEVKKDLGTGDEKRYRAAGFRGLTQIADDKGEKKQEIGVDWQAIAFSRVEAYVVDWSARDAKDKPLKLSRQAIEALDTESFDEIDEAVQAHIAAREEEKKQTSSASTPDVASTSAD